MDTGTRAGSGAGAGSTKGIVAGEPLGIRPSCGFGRVRPDGGPNTRENVRPVCGAVIFIARRCPATGKDVSDLTLCLFYGIIICGQSIYCLKEVQLSGRKVEIGGA
jgi:hypothetical protein